MKWLGFDWGKNEFYASDYFDQIYQDIELEKYSNNSAVDHEQMFIDGWIKGVKEFWEQVKEKLK